MHSTPYCHQVLRKFPNKHFEGAKKGRGTLGQEGRLRECEPPVSQKTHQGGMLGKAGAKQRAAEEERKKREKALPKELEALKKKSQEPCIVRTGKGLFRCSLVCSFRCLQRMSLWTSKYQITIGKWRRP